MSPVPLEALRQGKVVEQPRPGSHLARVLRLLRSNPDQAWRASEVALELDTEPHTIGAALRRLHARGLVDKKGPYWFALGERESAQLAGALAVTRELNQRYGPEGPADWRFLDHE